MFWMQEHYSPGCKVLSFMWKWAACIPTMFSVRTKCLSPCTFLLSMRLKGRPKALIQKMPSLWRNKLNRISILQSVRWQTIKVDTFRLNISAHNVAHQSSLQRMIIYFCVISVVLGSTSLQKIISDTICHLQFPLLKISYSSLTGGSEESTIR